MRGPDLHYKMLCSFRHSPAHLYLDPIQCSLPRVPRIVMSNGIGTCLQSSVTDLTHHIVHLHQIRLFLRLTCPKQFYSNNDDITLLDVRPMVMSITLTSSTSDDHSRSTTVMNDRHIPLNHLHGREPSQI